MKAHNKRTVNVFLCRSSHVFSEAPGDRILRICGLSAFLLSHPCSVPAAPASKEFQCGVNLRGALIFLQFLLRCASLNHVRFPDSKAILCEVFYHLGSIFVRFLIHIDIYCSWFLHFNFSLLNLLFFKWIYITSLQRAQTFIVL